MIDYQGGAYTYNYFLKDHLGNTRVSFTEANVSNPVKQVNNYYSFGMRFAVPWYNYQDGDGQKYLYNGKVVA